MFPQMKSKKNPLFLTARARVPGQDVADMLSHIPNVSAKLHAIGWKLAIEEVPGDADFYEDLMAFGMTHDEDQGLEMLHAFSRFLDAHAHMIQMPECFIYAWDVNQVMDRPRSDMSLHWMRNRTSSKVVSLFPRRKKLIS